MAVVCGSLYLFIVLETSGLEASLWERKASSLQNPASLPLSGPVFPLKWGRSSKESLLEEQHASVRGSSLIAELWISFCKFRDVKKV